MGQLIAFLIIGFIIYFIIYHPFIKPLIKPLFDDKKNEIKTNQLLSEKLIKKQKIFSIGISIYHLLFTLYFTILGYSKLKELNDWSLATSYDIGLFLVLGVILICLGVFLFQLLSPRVKIETLSRFADALSIQSIIFIFGSLLWGGILLINDQKLIGGLILMMIVVELIFCSNSYSFQMAIKLNKDNTSKGAK